MTPSSRYDLVKIVQMMREGAKEIHLECIAAHHSFGFLRIDTPSKDQLLHLPKAWQRCANTWCRQPRVSVIEGSIRRWATKTEETPTVHNTRTTVLQVTIPCWRTKAEGLNSSSRFYQWPNLEHSS